MGRGPGRRQSLGKSRGPHRRDLAKNVLLYSVSIVSLYVLYPYRSFSLARVRLSFFLLTV